jgi:endonuclease/exonuclease/phosphatase family protein
MTPKRTRGAAALALALIVSLLAVAALAGASGPPSIKVMTRNQYIGADLSPLLLVDTPEEFLAAAEAILAQVAANNFPRRALGLAREVLLTRPDVIGLQEVGDLSLNGQHPGPPFVDHLQMTLKALAALGLHYVVAAVVQHLDVTVPIDLDGNGTSELVRVLDRDVILVKAGIPFAKLVGNFDEGGLCGIVIPNPLPSPPPPLPAIFESQVSQDGCTYSVVGVVPSPFPSEPPLVVKRGFLGVDVRVGGKNYRIVNTHLEVETPTPVIQSLQAVELAGTLAATTPPGRTLILIGDFNSSPEDVGAITPPYQVLAAAGLVDVWESNLLAFADPDGFTCCQNADLANPTSLLSERIDLMWVREGERFQALALVTGRTPLLFSPVPHWASDHGGLFGTLVFSD